MQSNTLSSHHRPREYLAQEGSEKATLRQLLAVLLGSGCAGVPVTALSSAVEQLFLHGNTSIENLKAIPGIGLAKATTICAAVELGRRSMQHDLRIPFATPHSIYQACQDLCQKSQENLAVFYLNIRNQAIEREIVTIGTVSASLIHPREVFRSAISHNAASIILAHNHPSGSSEPSEADIEATRQIAKAGNLLGIRLIDHVICGQYGFVSLQERNATLFLADAKPFC